MGKITYILPLHPINTEATKASPVADFENNNINNGLTGDLVFINEGNPAGNMWIIGSQNHTTTGVTSAEAVSNALFAGTTDLSIDIQVVNTNSDLSFYYILDNRGRNVDFPHELRNDAPIVENSLQLWIDGTLKWEQTNVDGPFADITYTGWRQFQLSVDQTGSLLSPGPHQIRFTLKREIETPEGDLKCFLDDIQFPELLIKDDINGTNRWYYDGTQVRRARSWDWAERDNEMETDLNSRTSTAADFITYDWRTSGIYYGNPHYLCRVTGAGIAR
jgi:hypothetical protein